MRSITESRTQRDDKFNEFNEVISCFFWKGISFDVSAFVEICSTCQKTNPCYEKEKKNPAFSKCTYENHEPDWS